MTPKQWKLFHFMCAGAIIVAVLFIAVMKLLEKRDVVTFDQTLWVGETAAVLAFGASWLAKGLDLKYLKAELPEPPSSH